MDRSAPAIIVEDLAKSYKDVRVLDGISFSVEKGTILALLGPNGAGKTTTVHILSTLLLPDAGRATVAGHDVVSAPKDVKARIGLTGQFAAVDQYLTAEENLIMIGRLYRLSMADVKRRTRELLERFDLAKDANRPVRTFSGGMQRRLDLAMSLIAAPPVIFLDEPTTGLDPRSRLTMWRMIKDLSRSGTTILLTTQYMDEADYLADRIVVIDGGAVIAEGTAAELKARTGANRIAIALARKEDLARAKEMLGGDVSQADEERGTLVVVAPEGTQSLTRALGALAGAGIVVESVSLQRPTLDDVFLALTGHAAEAAK